MATILPYFLRTKLLRYKAAFLLLFLILSVSYSSCHFVMSLKKVSPYPVYVMIDSTYLYNADWYLSGIIGKVNQNDTLIVTGLSHNFLQVKHDNITGFISIEDISNSPGPFNSTTSPDSAETAPKISPDYMDKNTPGRTILTGPKGGKYYIDKKGNKKYIKKK